MDTILFLKLVVILALVMGNAFFVASEVSLTSARRSRIKQLSDMGNKSARVVQILQNEPERFYSVTQIGITLVSLALGAIGMITVSHVLDPLFETLFETFGSAPVHKGIITMAHTVSYGVAFVIISYLHVVAGELAPKVFAFHKAETFSLSVGWVINGLYRLLSSLIWFMNKGSSALLWMFGQGELSGRKEGHFSMSEEEIRTILSASEREGVLNPDETKMIRGVFDLDEHIAREAMVPRTDILAIPLSSRVSDALNFFRDCHHARIPVSDGNLDNIVGIIHMKELLNRLAEQSDNEELLDLTVAEIMQPPLLIPDSKPLSNLLKEFKSKRQHMAIVIDEFGGTAGLITMEDILEEIVGEMDDEFTPGHRLIKKLEGSEYIIDPSIRVSELEAAVNFPFTEHEDYVTLGGLIYKHLERIPEAGDVLDLGGGRLEILEMDNHRIQRVKFQDLAFDSSGELTLADQAGQGGTAAADVSEPT